jgi:hypothetical protein
VKPAWAPREDSERRQRCDVTETFHDCHQRATFSCIIFCRLTKFLSVAGLIEENGMIRERNEDRKKLEEKEINHA